jgi:uncharacterized membrane protein
MALSLAWGLADLGRHYPGLPDRVPSHFGSSGMADAWMDKQTFAHVTIGLFLFISVLMIGTAMLLRHLPSDSINLPNREYWLSPERRDQTLSVVSGQMLWFGAAIQTFSVGVFHLVYGAAMMATPMLDNNLISAYTGALLGFVAVWSIYLVLRFRVPA